MKILIAVDGSACSNRMLAALAAHDAMLGPGHQYTAFTIVPAMPAYTAAFVSRESIDGWYEEQAQAVLDPVRAFAKQNGWVLETHFAIGNAGDKISKLADEGGYDMIVMGTHGHSAIGNVVMGSVATRVLARSRKPVLLMH
jgi:nucleotide-binding universal stress UspA family protein